MRTMEKSRSIIQRVIDDTAGVTAVEYGLFAALIAAVIAGVVTTIGTDLNAMLGTLGVSL